MSNQWGTITSVEPPDSLPSVKEAPPTGPVFKHDLPRHLASTNYHYRETSQKYVGERRFSQPKRIGIHRGSYFVNNPLEKKHTSLLSRRRRSSLLGIIIVWVVLLAIFAAIAVGLWLAGKKGFWWFWPRLRTIWSLTIRTLWSWTIHNLEEFSKSKYAPGSYLKCTLLQEHVCSMLLEHYAFQIWSWRIFNLEYSSRLLMVEDHKFQIVQDHMVQYNMVLDHKLSQNIKKAVRNVGQLPTLNYYSFGNSFLAHLFTTFTKTF